MVWKGGGGSEGYTSQVLLSWSVVKMGTAGLRKALADLPGCWKLAGGLELCCDQWWLLHNPCGPRPAVLPDLNAGSGASKHSQAELVEVLDGCERGGSVCTINVFLCVSGGFGDGGGGGGGTQVKSC